VAAVVEGVVVAGAIVVSVIWWIPAREPVPPGVTERYASLPISGRYG
jgi:hypothetical protein